MCVGTIFLFGMLGIVVVITLGIVYYKHRRVKLRNKIRMQETSRLIPYKITDRIREGVKYCKYCGKPNHDESQFCEVCGNTI